MERKDLVSLLVTIDLGILAAALTLLAIYPAIIASIAAARGQAGASAVVAYEKRRGAIFGSLAAAALTSFLALMTLTATAVLTVAIPAVPSETVTICCAVGPARVDLIDLWALRLASLLTGISLLGVARAGWAILKLTKEAS